MKWYLIKFGHQYIAAAYEDGTLNWTNRREAAAQFAHFAAARIARRLLPFGGGPLTFEEVQS